MVELSDFERFRNFASLTYLLVLIAGTGFSFFFFRGTKAFTKAVGLFFALGHFSVLYGLVFLMLVCPSCYVLPERAYDAWFTFVITVFFVWLFTDWKVFSLYKAHISRCMIDLFFHARDTISFSFRTWLEIGGIVCVIFLFTAGLVFTASSVSLLIVFPSVVWFILALVFVVSKTLIAWGYACGKQAIIEICDCIPLCKPLRINTLLRKLGIQPKNPTTPYAVGVEKLPLNYPLHPIQLNPLTKKFNIVFLMAEAVRADMVTPDIMPRTFQWSKDQLQYMCHSSVSMNTFAALLGLFYGLPSSYWNKVTETQTPPVMMEALRQQGYEIRPFATAPLTEPPFDTTIFSGMENIRLQSNSPCPEGDKESLRDFQEYLRTRKSDSPFFSFVFFDSSHSFCHPKEFKHFKPAWDSPRYLELSNHTNPIFMKNLYMNSMCWIDYLFGEVIDSIKKAGIYEDTIIVMTGDHGQEINETMKNHWGHGSAYTSYQLRVPLFIHWPGMKPQVFSEVTCGYDIPITILRNALGMTNPATDVGLGFDLMDTSAPFPHRDWLLLGGYHSFAVKEGDTRIVEITRNGKLNFYTDNYNPHPDRTRSQNLYEAIQLNMRYRQTEEE